jgi:hypothetical protein
MIRCPPDFSHDQSGPKRTAGRAKFKPAELGNSRSRNLRREAAA